MLVSGDITEPLRQPVLVREGHLNRPQPSRLSEVRFAQLQPRAAELAESLEMETKRFKGNVRKLKDLGLTQSLKIGYRLSSRGEVVLERLQS